MGVNYNVQYIYNILTKIHDQFQKEDPVFYH